MARVSPYRSAGFEGAQFDKAAATAILLKNESSNGENLVQAGCDVWADRCRSNDL